MHSNKFDTGEPVRKSKAWLVSFTDVMALMLTFFVLLFSMSKPEDHQWQGMLSAFKLEFKKNLNDEWLSGPETDESMSRVKFDQAQPIRYLQTLFDEYKENNEDLSSLTIYALPDRLILSWPRSFFFEDGGSSVSTDGRKALYALSDRIARIKNSIQVVGRTADASSDNEGRDDWELSLQRSASVAAVLEKVGYSKPIVIRGDAAGRYVDLIEVEDEALRIERADRLDLVIMDNDGTIILNSVDMMLK